MSLPPKQGLYDPRNEHDACGVGFVVNIKGHKTHDLIRRGLQILINLDHRGAVGADPLVGDGAGQVAAGRLPSLSSWLVDVGLGVDWSGFGVYIAKAVTTGERLRLTARLEHRF